MRGRILPVLALFWLLARGALAGLISLETSITVHPRPDSLDTSVMLENKGDESAHNVELLLKVEGTELRTGFPEPLEPKRTVKKKFAIPWEGKLPGRYLAYVLVNYTDANQYPFSAPSVAPFVWKDARSPEIFCHLNDIGLDQRERLRLKLQNFSGSPITASLDLLVPKEFRVGAYPGEVPLSPYETRILSIPITNQLGTMNSSYPIYACARYDKGGYRYAAFAGAALTVMRKGFFRKFGVVIPAGLALLVAGGILLTNRKKGIRTGGAR